MSSRVNSHKCIFCFHTLKNTDICFETVDDTLELGPDPVKFQYQRQFDPNISDMDIRCMSRCRVDANGNSTPAIRQYEEGAPDIDIDPETGIPIKWREPGIFGHTSERRLCGICHQPLPESFGKMPNITVGLCGNSAAGKTVYMTSLIHDLFTFPDMSLTPDPVFYRGQNTPWEVYYNKMYGGFDGHYVLPPATSPLEQLSPLVLNCSYKGRNFSISMFDMAGEGMKDDSYMARNAIYLQNAAGIIFLKNPDYFPGMKKAPEALTEHQYLNKLMSAINNKNQGENRARLAITMTKFDLLLSKYSGDPQFDRLVGSMFDGDELSQHVGGFHVVNAMVSSQHMYRLYDWPNTRDQIIRNLYVSENKAQPDKTKQKKRGCLFGWLSRRGSDEAGDATGNIKQWVMLFAACPLGKDVVITEDSVTGEVRVDNQPKGLLNVDPLLWLLYCCDIFPAMETDD